jgi:hypothetical protein
MITNFLKRKYSYKGNSSSDTLSDLKTDDLQMLYHVSPFEIGGSLPIKLDKPGLRITRLIDLSGNGKDATRSSQASADPYYTKGSAEFVAAEETGLWSPASLSFTADTEGTLFYTGYLRNRTGAGTYQMLFIADGQSFYYFGVEIDVEDRYAWFSRNNTGSTRVQGTETFDDEELVVMTIKREGALNTVYINGVEVASSSNTDFLWVDDQNFRVTFGGLFRTASSDTFSPARLKTFAYYSRVMSDEEIVWKSEKFLELGFEEEIFFITRSSSAAFSAQFNVLSGRNATLNFYKKSGEFIDTKQMGSSATIDLSFNTSNEDVYCTITPTTAQAPLTSAPNLSNKDLVYFNNEAWSVNFGNINLTGNTEIETYGIRWGTGGTVWTFTNCHIADTDFFNGATQIESLTIRNQNVSLDWVNLQSYTPNLTTIDVVGASNQPSTVTIDNWASLNQLYLGLQTIDNSSLGIATLNVTGISSLTKIYLNGVYDIVTLAIDTCSSLDEIAGFTKPPSALANVSFVGSTNLLNLTVGNANLTTASMDALITQADSDGRSNGVIYFANENGGYSPGVQPNVDSLALKGWTSPGVLYPIP